MFFLFSPSKGTLLDKMLLSSRWPTSFFPTCNPLTNLDFSPNWSYCVSPVSCELSNIGKILWLTRVKAQSRLYSILSSISNQKSRVKHHDLACLPFLFITMNHFLFQLVACMIPLINKKLRMSHQCLLTLSPIWNKFWMFFASQDGLKPIQVAAARGNRGAVEILFPLTSKVQTIANWTVDGILDYMQSEISKQVLRSWHIVLDIGE